MGTLDDTTIQNLTAFATWTTTLNPASGTVSDAIDSKGLATAGSTDGTATIQAAFDTKTDSATLTSSHVTLIAVAPLTVTVPKGLTQQFTATGTLADANTQNLTTSATWSSSSPTVATISNTGLATALTASLTTNITASFNSIPSSPTATLTVSQPVLLSIAIMPNTLESIALGQTKQYTATGTYTDGTHDITSSVTWHSSNTSIASINSSGLAQSVAQGTITITTSLSGKTSNSATLTVTPPMLVSILVTPLSVTIHFASGITSQQFSATGTLTDGSFTDLTTSASWVSSSPLNIPISSTGLATDLFNIPDSTNITASFSGKTSNTATLTFGL
jgi:hypothetical protein